MLENWFLPSKPHICCQKWNQKSSTCLGLRLRQTLSTGAWLGTLSQAQNLNNRLNLEKRNWAQHGAHAVPCQGPELPCQLAECDLESREGAGARVLMPTPQGADGQRTWKVVGSLMDVVSQASGLRSAGAERAELEASAGSEAGLVAWLSDLVPRPLPSLCS